MLLKIRYRSYYNYYKIVNNLVIAILSMLAINFNVAYAENLLDVYYLAVYNDPVVLGARQDQLAATEQLVIARAKFLPNVSFQGTNTPARTTNDNLKNYNVHSYSLNLSQSIFQIVDWMNYRATKKQVLASLKRYEEVEQQLLLRVATQYFSILFAMADQEASRSATQAFTKQLEQASYQFKVGTIAITDVNEAQARLDAARAKEILDANALNTAKETLSQIIGKFIDNVAMLKPQIPLLPPDPNNIDLWLDKARKHNLQVQAVRYDVDAAREAIRSAGAGHLPTFNINGSITRSKYSPPIPTNSTDKQVTLGLNLPLFNGGATDASMQAAIFKNNAALQSLEAAYRTAEINTKVAYNTVIAQISQVEALQQSVKSSTVALKATKAAFDVGTRTMVDVLNAQSNLVNAQKDYAQARYSYIINSLKLKQATGALNITDLEQINDLLEKQTERPKEKSLEKPVEKSVEKSTDKPAEPAIK